MPFWSMGTLSGSWAWIALTCSMGPMVTLELVPRIPTVSLVIF